MKSPSAPASPPLATCATGSTPGFTPAPASESSFFVAASSSPLSLATSSACALAVASSLSASTPARAAFASLMLRFFSTHARMKSVSVPNSALSCATLAGEPAAAVRPSFRRLSASAGPPSIAIRSSSFIRSFPLAATREGTCARAAAPPFREIFIEFCPAPPLRAPSSASTASTASRSVACRPSASPCATASAPISSRRAPHATTFSWLTRRAVATAATNCAPRASTSLCSAARSASPSGRCDAPSVLPTALLNCSTLKPALRSASVWSTWYIVVPIDPMIVDSPIHSFCAPMAR